MKMLELRATRPDKKPNEKSVINIDKIEAVGITGYEVHICCGGDSLYREYYSSVEEAEHRYDEILLQLASAHEPAVLYEDHEPTIAMRPVDTSYNPCEFTIHTYPDEIEVASNNNAVSYPIGPDKCLLNVQAAFKELVSDIYSEVYEYYAEGRNLPIGTVDESRYISLESDDERVTKIIRNAIRLSNDKTCPSQIFVRYAGHTNSFEIDIHVNGWASGSEPDFSYQLPDIVGTAYAVTTMLRSLAEVEWVLKQLDYYANIDPSGTYLSRLRAALFEIRPQLRAEENSKSKS